MFIAKVLFRSVGLAALFSANAFAPSMPWLARRQSQQVSTLTSPSPRTLSSKTTKLQGALGKIELAGLVYDSTSLAFDAWEWTAVLGAPAALVAGAVLVTLSETRLELAPKKADKQWIRTAKQITRFLLMSSFALEVVSIFVSTVTGTVLLSHGEGSKIGYACPLGLLRHHHEFEYLTICVTFLQGLFHWLGAVALELVVPNDGEGLSARRMNVCLASCLTTLGFWILAFYNNHLSFYGDYFGMIRRVLYLFGKRFLWTWPIRPMEFLYVPSFFVSVALAWKAFSTPPDLDEE